FVEAETTDDTVANSQTAQHFFERTRLRASAVENCGARIRIVAHERGKLAANKFSLCRGILGLEEAQGPARAERRLQGFSEAVGIVADHGGGRVEDGLRGAVIFFQANNFRAGKIFSKTRQVSGACSAPAVNGLIFVTDNAD